MLLPECFTQMHAGGEIFTRTVSSLCVWQIIKVHRYACWSSYGYLDSFWHNLHSLLLFAVLPLQSLLYPSWCTCQKSTAILEKVQDPWIMSDHKKRCRVNVSALLPETVVWALAVPDSDTHDPLNLYCLIAVTSCFFVKSLVYSF